MPVLTPASHIPPAHHTPLLHQVSGQVLELANHHSASRVIQWCLKYASPEDKARLLGEVRGAVVPLSKSKYGWHVVTKLINVATKEEVPGGLPGSQGKGEGVNAQWSRWLVEQNISWMVPAGWAGGSPNSTDFKEHTIVS